MLRKYQTLVAASVIGLGAFALPASAGMPVQQNAVHVASDNPLLVEVKKDRDKHWKKNRGHGKWKKHRKHRHDHDHDDFALYINPFFFGGGYGYGYYDDWCYRRYGYRHWRCHY